MDWDADRWAPKHYRIRRTYEIPSEFITRFRMSPRLFEILLGYLFQFDSSRHISSSSLRFCEPTSRLEEWKQFLLAPSLTNLWIESAQGSNILPLLLANCYVSFHGIVGSWYYRKGCDNGFLLPKISLLALNFELDFLRSRMIVTHHQCNFLYHFLKPSQWIQILVTYYLVSKHFVLKYCDLKSF
jgi:hypothetical protein